MKKITCFIALLCAVGMLGVTSYDNPAIVKETPANGILIDTHVSQVPGSNPEPIFIAQQSDEPLEVTLFGVPVIGSGTPYRYTASVSGADETVNYKWYYRKDPTFIWVFHTDTDGSDHTHTFYNDSGNFPNQQIKVVATSNNESDFDIITVQVKACPDPNPPTPYPCLPRN